MMIRMLFGVLSFACLLVGLQSTAYAQVSGQTLLERINAERAARQGVDVTPHVPAYPHRSTRAPVSLGEALERLPRKPVTLRDVLTPFDTLCGHGNPAYVWRNSTPSAAELADYRARKAAWRASYARCKQRVWGVRVTVEAPSTIVEPFVRRVR